MIQFLGDIAGMLEIFAIAIGLVLLHRSKTEASPGLLRGAAWILILGGMVIGACTLYYWFSFRAEGALDTAVPVMRAAGEVSSSSGGE